jgi:hypothetical protein
MRKGEPKPVQFSLHSLFLATFAVSVTMAMVASLQELAVALLVPTVIAAHLCSRIVRHAASTQGRSLVGAWLFWIALLGITMVAWFAGY